MKKELKDIKKGDFVYCTGDSGFCTSSINLVTKVTTQYNEYDGTPYKVIWTGLSKYDARTGNALNPPLAYYIEPTDQEEAKALQKLINEEKAAELMYRKKREQKIKAALKKLTPSERKLFRY